MRRFTVSILASVSVVALCPSALAAQTATAAPAESVPATSQANPNTPTTPSAAANPTTAKTAPVDPNEIVVTGSRIRGNFTSTSPVDIITRGDTVLAGSRSTAEVLQSSSVTSGTAQINGAFLGFVSAGGAAVNSVGLRGLGPNRTLVLLNGRRLAPAGVGPQLVSADLNTLPSSIVKQTEILREGASSVYGSDAIAGVINVITDTKINGVILDLFTDQPFMNAGANYRASVTAGKTFSRGHITAAVEFRQQKGVRIRDNKNFTCPRDLFYQNGVEVGQGSPGNPSQLRCFPFQYDSIGTANAYGIGTNFSLPPSIATNRFTYSNGDPAGAPVNVNALNSRPLASSAELLDTVISPIKTYTGYINAGYELGALGDAELYGEALFTRRESRQDFHTQLSITPTALSPRIEIYGGSYGGTPLSVYGYPTSPFFPTGFANAGINRFTPFIVPQQASFASQRVDFFRANGGLRGHLGIGDWRYDANVQISKTRSREDVLNPTSDRLSNALQTVVAPAGTPAANITVALPGQANAGQSFTCASNVNGSGQFIAGSSCVPLNLYDPNIFLNGNIPANVYNYIYQENISHTSFDQNTFALNLDGTLMDLPAGPVKMSLGVEHRYDKIDDQPSPAALAGTLYNRTSGQRTRGSDSLYEAYGELRIPIVKDKPFFHDMTVTGSARYTHYRSYGSGVTYHIAGEWAPAEVIRFRGNYGTSFRAPNLYEQFVADQTGFFGPAVDPCNGFGTQYSPGTQVYTNCLAQLSPILGTAGAKAFIATQGPEVTTRGGAGNLKAEHSKSYGFGAVITVPQHIADLTFAADYWHIGVSDEVTTLGTLILQRCYEASDFPNNRYCNLIAPRAPASDPQRGNLVSFVDPYLNVSSQTVSGIDFDVRYATRLFGGKFVATIQATRNLHQKYALFADEAAFDYNGTLGTQGFSGGPKVVGNLDLRYSFPGDHVTVRYGLKYVGRQSSENIVSPTLVNGLPFDYDLVAERYIEQAVSVQYQSKELGQITLGVNNLFNEKPPTISGYPTSDGQYTRIGNYFNTSNYDFFGRSVFLSLTHPF